MSQMTTGLELTQLVPLIRETPQFTDVVTALREGHSGAIDGAWGSSSALATAAISQECPGTLLVILPRLNEVDDFALDLAGFLQQSPHIFPAWESMPAEHDVTDATFGGRLRLLRQLESNTAPLVVTSLTALLQPVPSSQVRQEGACTLTVGQEIDLDHFLNRLVEQGFQRVASITAPGEFALHGGILDLYPADTIEPLRVELFGDEIESIRTFDPETQRKTEDLATASFTLIKPLSFEGDDAPSSKQQASIEESSLFDSLPDNSWVVFAELEEAVSEARHYLNRLDDPRGLFSVEATLEIATRLPSVTIARIAADSFETPCHLQIESIERFTGPRNEVLLELASITDKSERVLITCHNEGERERLKELLEESELTFGQGVSLCLGRLQHGFRLVRDRLIVISDHELFGRSDLHREKKKRRWETRAIDSFLDLKEGDLVVHLTNGIGRFRGIEQLDKEGQVEEHLLLEFRDQVKVYVPVTLIHLVQKYVGSSKTAPKLSKLGTTSWNRKKEQVAKAVSDLASDMLRMQALRNGQSGYEFPPDSHYQKEFEALFPYEETPDQLTSIHEVKHDMRAPQPMDRLICGDVGYGKTEIAMRAAFKAIDAGKQVAILVPTTVLAEQHFRSFSERMAEFPVTLDVISRFRTKRQQREILERLERGQIDLIIGTHRLVQKDIRFKNLGLVIVDEEQRFGVEHKEMLKQIRLAVDVLTLSATPIPRTLHMSLLGIRDISNLTTPPPDRQAIETRICRFDPELIRSAIVRELNRGGQVYFVHNRVKDIHTLADRLQTIVPEARIGVGHGQMKGDELEQIMYDFVSHKIDILLSTTIIESGVDIPNANTMFIHQAGIYGLADMHQLRGRVGRYKHRAYCYLLLEEGKVLTTTAAKRLKAIEEYSELGAGFKIAMRDLEIRGAGNIIGTEQSGHIASVGYELYCQLLENAVRHIRNEPVREYRHVNIDLPVSAYLEKSFVPPGKPKIEVYRKLSMVQTLEELDQLREEVRDRFGPLPESTHRLFELKHLEVLARQWDIDSIYLEERFAVLKYKHAIKIQQLKERHGRDFRVADRNTAYWVLSDRNLTEVDLLEELKTVLQ
ncbi:MAG: transcription-repair coupling factor [Planctomycetaceae bacterium]|nr:transcription-repair coupling factor [Planctomycetaceae bacterium]